MLVPERVPFWQALLLQNGQEVLIDQAIDCPCVLISRYLFGLDVLDVGNPDHNLHELKTSQELGHTFVLFFRFLPVYVCSNIEMGALDALGDEFILDMCDLACFDKSLLCHVGRVAVYADSSFTEFIY